MTDKKSSPGATVAGVSLVGAGLAHFVAPQLFEPITKPAFPRDTARHIKINGSIETAIGVGLLVPKTRKLAVIGALGYVAYLGANAARNR
ncbi:hypothetical protein [Mycolicibacterium bacteremicum]|uniref:DoxX family protein n=1 Tax=Mycolicibacterium bacteremicum TaxID=564198 RepID=A0A1W9YU10_MYCBA|nr:hypothetical protein [Mycolicibacterium bacteremicum]MCV7432178.1 hypothetical protein [Mycolicibacterium bacteremicum]ORA03534.1 hypothetical protein BST17_18095 [Mycolicibacterium bacteremicum]